MHSGYFSCLIDYAHDVFIESDIVLFAKCDSVMSMVILLVIYALL